MKIYHLKTLERQTKETINGTFMHFFFLPSGILWESSMKTLSSKVLDWNSRLKKSQSISGQTAAALRIHQADQSLCKPMLPAHDQIFILKLSQIVWAENEQNGLRHCRWARKAEPQANLLWFVLISRIVKRECFVIVPVAVMQHSTTLPSIAGRSDMSLKTVTGLWGIVVSTKRVPKHWKIKKTKQ